LDIIFDKEMTEKQANKLFWEDYYITCKGCKNSCKQSSKVIWLTCCPNYDPIEVINDTNINKKDTN